MKLYDWSAIKELGDCQEFCQSVLGLQAKGRNKEWIQFNSPWRPGSDSGAFSVSKVGYKDFVSNETGSIIDLCANAKFNGDIWLAQEFLGEYLHLESMQEARQKKRLICVYDYHDADGKVVHQTCRYFPKDFRQRRPDPAQAGEWIWSLTGITPVLYRLPQLIESPGVCIVGGEKDADTLAALGIPVTTNPMGEGNWKPEYNECFRGKTVAIIPDRDETGRLHAKTISFGIKNIAASIRIIDLPFPDDAKPSKDPTDWVEYWRSKGQADDVIRDELREIIKTVRPVEMESIEIPKATQLEISQAKKANSEPFMNYTWEEQVDDKGREKMMRKPRRVNDMLDDLHLRFWDFPRRIGSTLFDHDRKTHAIRNLDNADKLFAWMAEKSGHCYEWVSINGAMTKKEFHDSVHNNSIHYEIISGVPNWPARTDAYYTHDTMPQPTEDAKYFNQFIGFFNPETEHDWHLLRAFVASPLYYKPSVQRPMWVIDTNDGQGAGKSRLAELVANLYSSGSGYGGPLTVEAAMLNNEMTSSVIFKRLLSEEGRQKRIVLIDNVTGFFKSSTLATLITEAQISGMRPYGKGEESRPNDLTYVVTSNRCTLDRDLVDRSFLIKIKRPTGSNGNWEKDVLKFIAEYRLNVIADIIHILDKGANFPVHPMSRFKTWEIDVLAPILGTLDTHSEVSKNNHTRREAADGDIVRTETIEEHVGERLMQLGVNPEKECVFLRSKVAYSWAREAMPGIGGGTEMGVAKVLVDLTAPSMKGRITTSPEGNTRYKGMRGFWFNKHLLDLGETTTVKVVMQDVEGVIRLAH